MKTINQPKHSALRKHTRFLMQLSVCSLITITSMSQAQIRNGGFEDLSDQLLVEDCVGGRGEKVHTIPPWIITETPDVSTEWQVVFDQDNYLRSALGFFPGEPLFDISPNGGCFQGFRSQTLTQHEGITQVTAPIADASLPISFAWEYTEYTPPVNIANGAGRCEPTVVVRINSTSYNTGTLLDTLPSVGATGGPTVEGQWVTGTTPTFVPSAHGINNGDTMQIYVGTAPTPTTPNGFCYQTWAFVDGFGLVPNPPTLTLLKTVVGDGVTTPVAPDNAFTLTASGTTVISGIEGDASVTNAEVQPGSYTFSDTAAAAFPGYVLTDVTCTGAADTNANDGLDLVQFEDVTCTLTNTLPPLPILTLQVDVVGGPAPDTAWILTGSVDANITPGGTFMGREGEPSVTSITVPVDCDSAPTQECGFTLIENNVANYSLTDLSCTGTDDTDVDGVTGNGLQVMRGDVIVCTFTNTYTGSGDYLTITKSTPDTLVTIGTPYEYTITVRDEDNGADINNVVVTDVVDASLTINSVTASNSGTTNITGNTVTCTWATIQDNQTETCIINVSPI